MARAVRLGDIPEIAVAGVRWRPVRRTLGVTAFGINAYVADAGQQVVEDHDEAGGGGAGGHEELYLVVSGRATFTAGGQEIDAPAGTLVWLPDPAERRSAVAAQDGTTVVAIGGRPGASGPVSPWEHYFAASAEEDPARAYEVTAAALADHPDNASVHFNLACFASLGGRRDVALDHLARAVELKPEALEWAAADSDLDAIRGDPRWPSAGR
jgi:hypothetical protein